MYSPQEETEPVTGRRIIVGNLLLPGEPVLLDWIIEIRLYVSREKSNQGGISTTGLETRTYTALAFTSVCLVLFFL